MSRLWRYSSDLVNESIGRAGNTPHKFVGLGDFNTGFLAPSIGSLGRII